MQESNYTNQLEAGHLAIEAAGRELLQLVLLIA